MKNFNNILESDIFCRFQNYKFFFSSNIRKKKFEENFEKYAENESYKLIYRYNLNLDFESLKFMFINCYYMKCEKRGFRVEEYSSDEFNVLLRKINEAPKFTITGVI